MSKLQPWQVEGLDEAYKDLGQLKENTRGIKIAAWVTAIATAALAIVGILTLIFQLHLI